MKSGENIRSLAKYLEGLTYDIEKYGSKRAKLIKVQNKSKAKHENDRVLSLELEIEMCNIAINDRKEQYNETIDKLVLTKFENVIHNFTELM